MENSKFTGRALENSQAMHSNFCVIIPSLSTSKSEIKPTEGMHATLAPRELADSEVDAMWARYPGLSFEDFFPAGESA